MTLFLEALGALVIAAGLLGFAVFRFYLFMLDRPKVKQ